MTTRECTCIECNEVFEGHFARKYCDACKELRSTEKKITAVEEIDRERVKEDQKGHKVIRNKVDWEKRKAAVKRLKKLQGTFTEEEVLLTDELHKLEKEQHKLQKELAEIEGRMQKIALKLGNAGFTRTCFGIGYDYADIECKEMCAKREECKRIFEKKNFIVGKP